GGGVYDRGGGTDRCAGGARGAHRAGTRRCRALCRQCGQLGPYHPAVELQRDAAGAAQGARLYRGGDAARSLPAQRRLSLLPDAAAGPPIGGGHTGGGPRTNNGPPPTWTINYHI